MDTLVACWYGFINDGDRVLTSFIEKTTVDINQETLCVYNDGGVQTYKYADFMTCGRIQP